PDATGVGLRLYRADVVDDRELLVRRDLLVTEDRHVLRAGDHRFVDLCRRRIRQRRRVLAVGQLTTRAGKVVALRAVGAEERTAESRVGLLPVGVAERRDRRTWSERRDIG